uniref:PI3K/PI4K domain-containing protein n=1 Tax=Ascaris lumbricoides TaxID=6252 RepID=A0A0M3IAR5_ASCLU
MHLQLVSVQFRNLMDRSRGSVQVGGESNDTRRALGDAGNDDKLFDTVCSVSSPIDDIVETKCDGRNEGSHTNETELSCVNSKKSLVYVETQPEDVLNAKSAHNEGDAHESDDTQRHEHRSESSKSPNRSLTSSAIPSFRNCSRVVEVSSSSTTVVGFTKSRTDIQSTRQILLNRCQHHSNSDFPLIYKTPGGTISVLLRYGVVVEVCY